MHAGLHEAGYALLQGALTQEACRALAAALPDTPARAGGQRGVPDTASAREVIDALDALAQSLLQAPVRAVRAVLFDKTPQSNWAVPWHQDLGIPVRERHECAGFRAWSMKEGIWHVQPPHVVLERMLTLRLHLDDCGSDNAPLHVLPGSHALGRLDGAAVRDRVAQGDAVACPAAAGVVLAMRPCLLHASFKAMRPRRRRVLHVEFASDELPAPLQWATVNAGTPAA